MPFNDQTIKQLLCKIYRVTFKNDLFVCFLSKNVIWSSIQHNYTMHTMTFYWSADIGDFFFKGLTINNAGALVGLCIVLVVLSVVYEAMKVHLLFCAKLCHFLIFIFCDV